MSMFLVEPGGIEPPSRMPFGLLHTAIHLFKHIMPVLSNLFLRATAIRIYS